MAIWTTAIAGQRLRIDAEGVECDGILGRTFLPWYGLRDVHVTSIAGSRARPGATRPATRSEI